MGGVVCSLQISMPNLHLQRRRPVLLACYSLPWLGAAQAQAISAPNFQFSRESDIFNQAQAMEYFEKKYYNEENRWALSEESLVEAANLGRAAQVEPSLALGAAQVLYLFGWFTRTGEIIRENILFAAQLFEQSIGVGGCDNSLTVEAWLEGACDIRFGSAALLYNWLGETEKDATQALKLRNHATEFLNYLKTVPRFKDVKDSWTHPLHMNFNQLRFPNIPSQPFWDSRRVPLAQFLEENFAVFREELDNILAQPGDLYEELRKADGSIESLATPGGWDAIRIVRYGHWFEGFCEVAPRTCALLRTRPELVNCPYVNTNYYKLFPSSHLKPHFGNAPRLTAHLPVIAPEPLRSGISVGTEQSLWREGKVLVLDDTYPHSVSHWGTKPRYVLATWFCHPCDEDTDHKQTCPGSL